MDLAALFFDFVVAPGGDTFVIDVSADGADVVDTSTTSGIDSAAVTSVSAIPFFCCMPYAVPEEIMGSLVKMIYY